MTFARFPFESTTNDSAFAFSLCADAHTGSASILKLFAFGGFPIYFTLPFTSPAETYLIPKEISKIFTIVLFIFFSELFCLKQGYKFKINMELKSTN